MNVNRQWLFVGFSLAWLWLPLFGQKKMPHATRPDPQEVVFLGQPEFDKPIRWLDPLTNPRPMELLNHPYPEVHETGQSLLLGVPRAGEALALEFDEKQTPAPIAMRILGPVSGFRIASAGEPFPGDFQDLVSKLGALATTDKDRAMVVFKYVDNHIRQWWFPAEGYQNIHLHSEEVARQIWGFGYGFCSDVARISVALWESLGLKARIVSIDPFHTVAEVFYDDAWHLFDVQHKSFWRNEQGVIASASELRADPRPLWRGLDQYGLDRIGYPPLPLEYWYQQGQITYHKNLTWVEGTDFGIHLREGEFFEIDYVGQPHIYHPDYWVQAYGERTLRRDPPWPYRGRQYYVPSWFGAQVQWQTLNTEDGRTAYVFPMQSPYLFTEAMLRLPALAEQAEVFVYAHDRFQFVSPMKAQGARLGRLIAGTTNFAVCIVVDEALEKPDEILGSIEIRATVQMSHLAVPKIRSGKNALPVTWHEGQPTVFFWYRADGPDLTASYVESPGKEPVLGQNAELRYRIKNQGSGASWPTKVALYNTTTALFSENVEPIGWYTIPPLQPGESYELTCHWKANTRLNWYGQNPQVQHFELRMDPHRQRADANGENQYVKHHVLVRDQDGKMPTLPGYSAYPATKKALELLKGWRLH